MKRSSLRELASMLRASSLPTHFGETESRLLVAVWRAVAAGEPVPVHRIQEIAGELAIVSETAVAFVEKISERDGDGNVVGIFGLSQRKHPHKFIVDGRVFFTWCAWDALFLPPMLQERARVESVCPQTGKIVTVKLSPEQVESCSPAGAVVSIVVPDQDSSGFNRVEEVWSAFCCDVHFFQSREVAGDWLSKRGRQARVLSIADAFQLGLLTFREILQFV